MWGLSGCVAKFHGDVTTSVGVLLHAGGSAGIAWAYGVTSVIALSQMWDRGRAALRALPSGQYALDGLVQRECTVVDLVACAEITSVPRRRPRRRACFRLVAVHRRYLLQVEDRVDRRLDLLVDAAFEVLAFGLVRPCRRFLLFDALERRELPVDAQPLVVRFGEIVRGRWTFRGVCRFVMFRVFLRGFGKYFFVLDAHFELDFADYTSGFTHFRIVLLHSELLQRFESTTALARRTLIVHWFFIRIRFDLLTRRLRNIRLFLRRFFSFREITQLSLYAKPFVVIVVFLARSVLELLLRFTIVALNMRMHIYVFVIDDFLPEVLRVALLVVASFVVDFDLEVADDLRRVVTLDAVPLLLLLLDGLPEAVGLADEVLELGAALVHVEITRRIARSIAEIIQTAFNIEIGVFVKLAFLDTILRFDRKLSFLREVSVRRVAQRIRK